jgi:hypothetical protein
MPKKYHFPGNAAALALAACRGCAGHARWLWRLLVESGIFDLVNGILLVSYTRGGHARMRKIGDMPVGANEQVRGK